MEQKTVLNSKIKAFCLLGYFTTNKPLIYEELDTKYYRYISKVCIFQILKSTIVIRDYWIHFHKKKSSLCQMVTCKSSEESESNSCLQYLQW